MHNDQKLEDIQRLWVNDILSIAQLIDDEFYVKAFGCNVFLAFNIGLDIKTGSPNVRGANDLMRETDAKFDFC